MMLNSQLHDNCDSLETADLLSFVENIYHSDTYTSWSEMDSYNDTTIIDNFISLIELLQYPERLLKLTYEEGRNLTHKLGVFLPHGNEKDHILDILDVDMKSF